MVAEVIKGELVYINTGGEIIHIIDDYNQQVTLKIDEDTELPYDYSWPDLMAERIGAVVIDGKVSRVYRIIEDE